MKDCETVSMSELITRVRVLVSGGVRKWQQSPAEGHLVRLGNWLLLVIQTMVKWEPKGLMVAASGVVALTWQGSVESQGHL